MRLNSIIRVILCIAFVVPIGNTAQAQQRLKAEIRPAKFTRPLFYEDFNSRTRFENERDAKAEQEEIEQELMD